MLQTYGGREDVAHNPTVEIYMLAATVNEDVV